MKRTTKARRPGPRKIRPDAVAVPSEPVATEVPAVSVPGAFPIVGIGASAGGLEALEVLLRHVPVTSEMALVIVLHLDPSRRDMMAELLQRATDRTVVQARNRMRVQPRGVYVIPPNKDLSIRDGVLQLTTRSTPHGARLPIDRFFRALAADQRGRSVGMILSGMGTDGTLGLQAIKEEGGVVLVQTPSTAKFDGMPRSAISTGMADIVGSPEELATKLPAFLAQARVAAGPDPVLEDHTRGALDRIAVLLRAHTGHDFSRYKKNTVYRRVERRMGLHQFDNIAGYVRYLQENRQELDLLFKELLIGVTSFFRDPGAWEHLREHGIPSLLCRPSRGRVMRAWVPGCSSGEEAYSLAIVFREALEKVQPNVPCALQIFATDLDRDAIDKARLGVFPSNIAADVSPKRLARFFVKDGSSYRVGKEVREMVVFAPQNVIMDPPFTKLDLLTCRNLLIYLEPEPQKKLIPLFHYSLNAGGLLFLGSAESTGGFEGLFSPLDSKSKLFRKLETPTRSEAVEFPSSYVPEGRGLIGEIIAAKLPSSLQTQAEQLLLQKHAPPAVLTNDRGDILFVSGRTGRYLEPAAGKANWNVFAMAREGLRYELAGVFQRVARRGGKAILRRVKVGGDGPAHWADVAVERVEAPEGLRGGVLIAFHDLEPLPRRKASGRERAATRSGPRLLEIQHELQQTRLELHSTRDQAQTSQEELRSMNEELQSTNEELQSTNEELTTSKEEMQSLNEELQTVNAELRAKLDELSRANSDMKNLLNSTEIATLFLDPALNVRRFTTAAARIIKLLPGDVGRPVTDLASTLLYADLLEDARGVLRTLVFSEKRISTRGGDWYSVRIMPYRTLENVIDGVVITFIPVTGHRPGGEGGAPGGGPDWTTELKP